MPYYKINTISKTRENARKIFVVDTSGSMDQNSYLINFQINELAEKGDVALLFSDQVTRVVFDGKNTLQESHIDHSSTDISKAIFALINELNNIKMGEQIKVIFISDGTDSDKIRFNNNWSKFETNFKNSNNLDIDFICIGVSTDYPANDADRLRKIFHTGGHHVQPLYRVLNSSEWEETFNTISNLVVKTRTFNFKSPISLGPWDSTTTTFTVKENKWFYTTASLEEIENELVSASTPKLLNVKISTLSKDDINEIAFQWKNVVQSIANSDLSAAEIKTFASGTKAELANLIASFRDSENAVTKKSVYDRVKAKNNSITDIISEITKISQGTFLKDLTNEEKAKRLAIGTQSGKHDLRITSKFGQLSPDDFKKYKQEFIFLIKEFQILPEYETALPESSISLQSLYEVFRQPDLVSALEAIENQYDFAELFPLVGRSINIVDNNASLIESHVVNVDNIGKTCQFIDSVSLQTQQDVAANEKFNSVLFTITEKDKPLFPLISSKMFSFLFTFATLKKVDVIDPEAHVALLINTWCWLTSQESSSFNTNILKEIETTFDLLYAHKYRGFVESLKNEGNFNVLVTASPKIETKCQSLVKFLFYFCRYKQELSEPRRQELAQHFVVELFSRKLHGDVKVVDVFRLVDTNIHTIDQGFVDKIKYDQYTLDLFKTDLKELITKHVVGLNCVKPEIRISSKFLNTYPVGGSTGTITPELLQAIEKEMGVKFDLKSKIDELHHAISYRNSYECQNSKIVAAQDQIVSELVKIDANNIVLNYFSLHYPEYEKIYIDKFFDSHYTNCDAIIPVNTETLNALLKEIGSDKSASDYEIKETGLLKDACMCKNCPEYLKINSMFNCHLLPVKKREAFSDAFHVTIYNMWDKPAQDILNAVKNQNFVNKESQSIPYVHNSEFDAQHLREIEIVKARYKLLKGF